MSESNKMKRLLYLAPEVPALSATFVYNEILALQEIGHSIRVVSVHNPEDKVDDKTAAKFGRVTFLYDQSFFYWLICFLVLVVTRPIKTIKSLFTLVKDVFKVGIFTRNSFGLVYRYLAGCSLAKDILKQKIEHIHAHFAHVPADIAMYASAISDVDISIVAHANDIFQRGWLLNEKIERCKFFVTISEYNKNYLLQYSKRADKIKVIHCGVHTENFNPRKAQPKNAKYIFGFLGRLVEKKGAKVLLAAISHLRTEAEQFELQIIGNGPEKEELITMVKSKGLNQYVKFLGKMPNSKISAWLNSIDCFVLPCIKDKNGDMDGIPVSLMEAMIMGVPVISTNISGVPELIINEDTGFIAKSNSIEDLSDKMISIMNLNEAEISKIVSQAISHIKSEFEINHNAQRLSKYISQ